MLSEYFKQILFVHLYMACFFKTKEVLVLKKRGLGFKGTILWFYRKTVVFYGVDNQLFMKMRFYSSKIVNYSVK